MKKLFSLVLALAAITTMTFADTSIQQDCGKKVRITAHPEDGYEFVEWEDGNTDNPRIVTVSANATYTAIFAKQKITIPAGDLPNPDDVDTDGTKPGGEYEYGDILTFTPKDKECREFSEWLDHNTDNPRTFTVGVDDLSILQQIVPQYTDIYYTIRFFQEDETTQIGQDQTVACGNKPDTIGIVPTKQNGEAGHEYVFKGWNVKPAAKDTDYIAQFADTKTKYPFDGDSFDENVDVEDENGNEPNGEYEFGDTFTVTAKDSTCMTFIGWSDQSTAGKERTFTVGVSNTDDFVPQYEDIYYTITFRNWNNELIGEEQNVKCGDMPQAPANPTKDQDAEHTYTFNGWNTTIVAASQDAEYVAVYEQHDRIYNLNNQLPDDDERVEVTGKNDDDEYKHNDQITFEAKPVVCEEFIGWGPTSENIEYGTDKNPFIFVVGETEESVLVNIKAQYKAIQYTITTAVKLGDDSQTHGTVSAEVVE